MSYKKTLKKIWHFIWEDDSVWSWLVNIALAFVIIKYIVYPGLGLVLSTSHPVVAVVSESMEHNSSFEDWWKQSSDWYIANGITKEEFQQFSLSNGFNKGDIMVLKGKTADRIKTGDIVVFWSARKDPIIHRVVKKWQENNMYYFQTKGDNYNTNPVPISSAFLNESRISQEQIVGNAILKVPLLGYIKIWFVELVVNPLSVLIQATAQKG